MSDNVEERKEKIKPTKLFSVAVTVFDDGVLAGVGIEYRNIGRLRNQKIVVPGKEEFEASVRSIIPSALPTLQPLVDAVYADHQVEDNDGMEKIGKVQVDVYSDGFIEADYSEIVKSPRGAPRNWRLPPHEFIKFLETTVGNVGNYFKPLIGN